MKVLYITSTGASDETRASIPIHLAVNGSAEIGHETQIVLAGDAAELVIGDAASKIAGKGLPPMAELLEKVRKHKLAVYV